MFIDMLGTQLYPSFMTWFSPYYLMFGCDPRLPLDVIWHICCQSVCSLYQHECAKIWSHIKYSVKQSIISTIIIIRPKRHQLKCGEMVLVCITTYKGQHKIQDHWDNQEHIILRQPYPSVPVYVVVPQGKPDKECTLPHTSLLPLSPNRADALVASPDANTSSGQSSAVTKQMSDSWLENGLNVQGSIEFDQPAYISTWGTVGHIWCP